MKKTKLEKNKGFKSLNRKGFIGEGDKMLFWLLIVVPFITFLIVFLVAWASGMKDIFLNKEIEPKVYESRLLYSGNCFAYVDENGRTYPGVIDVQKFNTEIFRECVPIDGATNMAMLVELKTGNGDIVGGSALESTNWGINTKSIQTRSYVVEIKDVGPGVITFSHKISS